jgi:mRNA interferase RelE/StbE
VYKVEYAKSVVKDLKLLPKETRKKALAIIEKSLAQDPYLGRPLTGPFKGLYKYRIGDYRIIYTIEQKKIILFVLKIRHRKDVYRGLI